MAADSRLHLSNIKVDLPNGRRLFSIDELVIAPGTHLLVQGESGTGKTTFLHLLAGLFTPTSGSVSFGPSKLEAMSDDEKCDLRREKVGVIFQKLNLLDHLTVAENVSLPFVKTDRTRVLGAIEKVNLRGRADDRCSFLSLGEQQRVAVARVLAQNPDVYFADEPTSSLDEKNADFVIRALIEAARGKTLIVVSHDRRLENHFSKTIRFEGFTR